MLHDRPYMRTDEFRTGKPMWMILIIVNVVCFALQLINNAFIHVPLGYLALSPTGIGNGYIWQFLTYQFLHGGMFHLLMNMFIIWMFGRYIEERLGRKTFLKLYLLGGVAGGILQVLLGFLFPDRFGALTMGASAGALGLIAAFCALDPHAEIRLFFVLPLRARQLLYLEIGIAAFFTIVQPPLEAGRVGVAHAAHLGGILFALAYIRWAVFSTFTFPKIRFRREPRREYVKAAPIRPVPGNRPKKAAEEELPPEKFISQEVDPILDKISEQGIHSLTERERKILEAARKKMSKH